MRSSKVSVAGRVAESLLYVLGPLTWIGPAFGSLIRWCAAGRDRRRVLFVIQNIVALDYAACVIDLLREDSSIDLSVTDDKLYRRNMAPAALKEVCSTRYVNIVSALFQRWDLVVYLNHPWQLGIWFAPFLRKVYINHGLSTGKINNSEAQDGIYGATRVLRPFGSPFYTKMFAASWCEREQALLETPSLKGRVVVTGFLRADLLEQRKNDRDEIRRRLGFQDSDIVVHVISTWGSDSLEQTLGDALRDACEELSHKFRFVVSLHPRHDHFGDTRGRPRADIASAWRRLGGVVGEGADWEEHVLAGDIAIADHSSLCMYYVVLGKPLVLTPVARRAYRDNGMFGKLRSVAPTLRSLDDLESQLRQSLELVSPDAMQSLRLDLRSYPGRAAQRFQEELASLLVR